MLTDAVSYLSQLRDQQQTQSEREKKRPKRGGEGAVTDAAVTDSAVAAADLRGGLLSSRELFCVELVVDPGDSEEHATMAALGEGAQEFFRSSPWGDMHGHVFYHLIHPEDRPKLDALLRQHEIGERGSAVTRMRLVYFRTCEMELNLQVKDRAHDASLAAASSVPDENMLPDDPLLAEDPLLDFNTGAFARPCETKAAEVARGKTFIVAGHVALDFQLVSVQRAAGQGGLAGCQIVLMASLHTATPPLPAVAQHKRVRDEQIYCRMARSLNGIYTPDLSASSTQAFDLGQHLRVAAPRTAVTPESSHPSTPTGTTPPSHAAARSRPPVSRARELTGAVREDFSFLSRLRSGLVATSQWVMGAGIGMVMRMVQFHFETSADEDGVPILSMHVRLHLGDRIVFPWRLLHSVVVSGSHAIPMSVFRTKPEDQVFLLPVIYDDGLPQQEKIGASFFFCQPREGWPLPSDLSTMPCEGLMCGNPHVTNIFHQSNTGQWSLVRTRCPVAGAVKHLVLVKTGEADEALASFASARSAEWKLPL